MQSQQSQQQQLPGQIDSQAGQQLFDQSIIPPQQPRENEAQIQDDTLDDKQNIIQQQQLQEQILNSSHQQKQ